jgi:hypothetical protein
MKSNLVGEIGKLKLYPYFILQVLLLSQDLKLVDYSLQILCNLSQRPNEIVEVIVQNEESCSFSKQVIELNSGLERIQDLLK